MSLTKEQETVKRAVVKVVNSLIHNHDDRQDMLQRIYEKLYSEYPHYKEQGKVVSWATTLAINECYTYYRMLASWKTHFSEYAYFCSTCEPPFPEVSTRDVCADVLEEYSNYLRECESADSKIQIDKEFFLAKKNRREIARNLNSNYKRILREVDSTILKLNQLANEILKQRNNEQF